MKYSAVVLGLLMGWIAQLTQGYAQIEIRQDPLQYGLIQGDSLDSFLWGQEYPDSTTSKQPGKPSGMPILRNPGKHIDNMPIIKPPKDIKFNMPMVPNERCPKQEGTGK